MDTIRKLYAKVEGFARGQTMTEYALILAAVAVVVYVGYQTMGTTITSMLSNVDTNIRPNELLPDDLPKWIDAEDVEARTLEAER